MGSFTHLTYHIVFATKYRKRTLQADVLERLYEYLGGTLRNKKGHLIEIGGVENQNDTANLQAKTTCSIRPYLSLVLAFHS